MKPETKITIINTITCILFGLWQDSIFAGFFLAFLLLCVLSMANALLEIWLEKN